MNRRTGHKFPSRIARFADARLRPRGFDLFPDPYYIDIRSDMLNTRPYCGDPLEVV